MDLGLNIDWFILTQHWAFFLGYPSLWYKCCFIVDWKSVPASSSFWSASVSVFLLTTWVRRLKLGQPKTFQKDNNSQNTENIDRKQMLSFWNSYSYWKCPLIILKTEVCNHFTETVPFLIRTGVKFLLRQQNVWSLFATYWNTSKMWRHTWACMWNFYYVDWRIFAINSN